MLLGADAVGVVDVAAETQHAEHGGDHDHTLEEQGQLELLPHPGGGREGGRAGGREGGRQTDYSSAFCPSVRPN